MRVTGREKSMGWDPIRLFLQRPEARLALASSSRPAKKWATPMPMSGLARCSRGLRRNEVSKCFIARSGSPAHALSQPLHCQPRAELGLSFSPWSTRAIATSISSPKRRECTRHCIEHPDRHRPPEVPVAKVDPLPAARFRIVGPAVEMQFEMPRRGLRQGRNRNRDHARWPALATRATRIVALFSQDKAIA